MGSKYQSRRELEADRVARAPRKTGTAVGDVEIEKLRARLMDGWTPEAETCQWCDRPAETRYMGVRACEHHENLLQQRAIEDQTRLARIPLADEIGGFDGED